MRKFWPKWLPSGEEKEEEFFLLGPSTNAPCPIPMGLVYVDQQGNRLCIISTGLFYPVYTSLSLNGQKISGCRPALLPAAMAHICASSSSHNLSLPGAFGSGSSPVRIYYCRPLAAECPAAAMFVLFVPSTRIFRAKVVYMVLGSSHLSARKILASGPSTTFWM